MRATSTQAVTVQATVTRTTATYAHTDGCSWTTVGVIGGSVGALSDWIGLDGVGEECATAAPIQMGSQAPNAITRQQGMGTRDVAARHG
jgi:hypothetical protein